MAQDRINVTGMVLSAMPLGEFDRRLTVLTQQHGKITVFARGARRPSSPYGAATRPFAMGSFELAPQREAYSLCAASVRELFEELTMDLEACAYGSYFLEFASCYSAENVDGTNLLNLLYVSLQALIKGQMEKPLIRRIFEARAMWDNGEFPEIGQCARCAKTLSDQEPGYYINETGTLLCEACMEAERARRVSLKFYKLSPDTIYTFDYILHTPLTKLFSFRVRTLIFEEIQQVMKLHIKKHIYGSFKSLAFIEEMGL